MPKRRGAARSAALLAGLLLLGGCLTPVQGGDGARLPPLSFFAARAPLLGSPTTEGRRGGAAQMKGPATTT